MKRKTRLRQTYLFFIAAALICLVVLGAKGWSSRTSGDKKISSQQDNEVVVGQNKTQHLEVVSIEQTDDGITLVLKNGYNKRINAFTISIGSTTISNDYVYSDEATAPGAQYTFLIPRQYPAPGQLGASTLNILAVIFDDGTGDGEGRRISDIIDNRSGKKIQLRRILPLLQKALKASDDDLLNALDELTLSVSTLPELSDSHIPENTLTGARSSKRGFLKIIQAMKQSRLSSNRVVLRNQLLQMKKHYETLITKL
jgi:hypothetical protein